jgi:hypothetical protein
MQAATIAFNDNTPAADTITDSGSGFIAAGFSAGDKISASGSSSNDGTYTIDTLTAGVITLIATDALTDEVAGNLITLTRLCGPGNYIGVTDVDNWLAAMDSIDQLKVINRIEAMVERITHDLFYSADFDIYRDGNGKNRLHLGLTPDILSVTSIAISGVTLSTDYYTYDANAVYLDCTAATALDVELLRLLRRGRNLFPEGVNNIRVIGTYGHASCPELIKQACIILARNENDSTLYTHYIEGTERIADWSYTAGKQLTGVKEADDILKLFVRKKTTWAVV